jgi:hypothetical protein
LCITIIRIVIERDKDESFVSRGYTLNTSSITTILSSLTKSFIALTTICSSISYLLLAARKSIFYTLCVRDCDNV